MTTTAFTAASYAIGADGIVTTAAVAATPIVCVVKPILSQDRLMVRGIKYQWNGGPESIMTITTPLHQDWKAVYNCGVSHNSDFYALSHYLEHQLKTRDLSAFMDHCLDQELSIQDAMLALLCISRVLWVQLLKQLRQTVCQGKVLPEMQLYQCHHQHARVLLLPMMASMCGKAAPPHRVISTVSQYHGIIADLYQGTHDIQAVALTHSSMATYLWQPESSTVQH